MQSRRQDRGFQHGVFCPVEAEEVSQAADVNDFCADVGAVVSRVDRLDLKLVPATGGGEHSAVDVCCGECFWRRFESSDRGFRQQQDVIDDINKELDAQKTDPAPETRASQRLRDSLQRVARGREAAA